MRLKFISGMVVGVMLCVGTLTLSAQNEARMHPRLATAIEALRDARGYLAEAPHNFGGHKVAAMRACDNAIRELEKALAFRERRDR